MTEPNPIVFLDLETSGLEIQRGAILELAMLAVNPKTFLPVAAFSSPIHHRPESEALQRMNNFVREMHTSSGLLEACEAAPRHSEVGEAAMNWMREVGASSQAYSSPMCGANIGSFDRQWLNWHLPPLVRMFHYRDFDTQAFWMLSGFAFDTPPAKKHTAHRALPDCYQSLNAVRTLLGLPEVG